MDGIWSLIPSVAFSWSELSYHLFTHLLGFRELPIVPPITAPELCIISKTLESPYVLPSPRVVLHVN